MATRYYFPETLAAPVTPPAPAGGAEWEHVNSVQRSALRTPDASALTTTAYTPDSADDVTNRDAHHRQYVTESLAAQAIAGTVTAQLQCLEAHANNQLFLALKIYVVDETGASAKETLLALTRATSLELGTTIANRTFPSTALTGATLESGDRIVMEIGLGGNVTTVAGGVQGHNGSLRWGCSAAGGDLPANETEAGTTLRPWLEFSQTLAALEVPAPSLTMPPYRAAERAL